MAKLFVAVIDRDPDPQPWRRTYRPSPAIGMGTDADGPLDEWDALARERYQSRQSVAGTLVGTDRDALIRRALEVRRKMGEGYRILVGELTVEVREPVTFEETPLRLID